MWLVVINMVRNSRILLVQNVANMLTNEVAESA